MKKQKVCEVCKFGGLTFLVGWCYCLGVAGNTKGSTVVKQPIDKLVADFKKRGMHITRGTEVKPVLGWVPTGSLLLDYAISGGKGYPRPKIIEISGSESSGKSILTLLAEAWVTQQGMYVVHCDTENNYSHQELDVYRDRFGVNREFLFDIHNEPAEVVTDMVRDLLRDSGYNIGLVVVDSIGAFVTNKNLDRDAGQGYIPDVPKLVNDFCRKINQVNKTACVMMVSHLMDNIGSLSPLPVSKGGRGLKHFNFLKLEVTGKPKQDSQDASGFASKHEMSIKIRKNKVQRVYLDGVRDVVFDMTTQRFDTTDELIRLGVIKKIIQVSGPWYQIGDQKFQGRENFKKLLDTSPEWMSFMHQAVMESA